MLCGREFYLALWFQYPSFAAMIAGKRVLEFLSLFLLTKHVPCGTKFLRVLIFAIFGVFSAIRKNKFPQMKITANIFPAKIYSSVNILSNLNSLHKHSVLRNRDLQSQLVSFIQKQRNTGLLLENMYFYCTYSIKTKILWMLGTRGGDSHMKQTGMLVVSLRGVNFGIWSRLGCSGQSANILRRQGLV